MTLLYVFMAVVVGAIVLWWWQGVSALSSLELGEQPPREQHARSWQSLRA